MKKPKQVVQEFFADFSTGDVAKTLGHLTPDATWWVSGKLSGMSGEYSKDAFGNLLRQAVTLYKDHALQIKPSSMISEGDSVAVEADGYAALLDGRVYVNQYHFRIDVEGERIRRVREYSDTQQMAATFGVP